MGEAVYVWGKRYIPLDFIIYLKLLKKILTKMKLVVFVRIRFVNKQQKTQC